jgi:hypothetical protein
MSKSEAAHDLDSTSTKAHATKAPRKRTPALAESATNGALSAARSSSVKPLLIGLGVGAAVAATALVVNAQLQRTSRRPSGLGGTLAKAALFALTRVLVQRAAGAALEKATTLKLEDIWPQRQNA